MISLPRSPVKILLRLNHKLKKIYKDKDHTGLVLTYEADIIFVLKLYFNSNQYDKSN